MGWGFVARRVAGSLIVVVGALIAVFFLARLRGDPVYLMVGPGATEEIIAQTRHAYGLDRPLHEQLGRFLGGAVRGDFGTSLRQEVPVLSLVMERLPNTILLTVLAIAVSTLSAVVLGSVAATRRGHVTDRLVMGLALLGQCMPVFWLGLMLILVFGMRLQLLPSSGIGSWRHLILPTITLAAFTMARTARLVRSGLLDALQQDYVRTARAKGVREWRVVLRHGLRNALLPVITVLGLEVGQLMGGAVITETIFAWPGVGSLVVDSIFARDFPVIQGAVFVIVVTVVAINFVIDLAYLAADPRITYR